MYNTTTTQLCETNAGSTKETTNFQFRNLHIWELFLTPYTDSAWSQEKLNPIKELQKEIGRCVYH